jgi:S1-C subfamily serine protease
MEIPMKIFMTAVAFMAMVTLARTATARGQEVKAQEPVVTVRVRAILVDGELTQKAVPHLAVKIVAIEVEDASEATAGANMKTSVEVKTNFEGVAEIRLRAGKYRVSSPEGIEFAGARYTWDMEINVAGAEQTIELSNDNAKVAGVTSVVAARKTDELTTLFQKYKNSVVTVWSETGHGTGVIVDMCGLIVTNQHVIGPSELISVQFDAKRKVEARLLAFSAEKDVAILWANLAAFPEAIAAPIAKSEGENATVVEGERVFTIGSPLSQRKILTTGIVSKVEAGAILSDININPGNSGGALFNSVGDVVGITTFGEQDRSGPGIAGIIRIEESFPVLEQARTKMAELKSPSAKLQPVEPTDAYPLDSLKESIQAAKFDRKPYIFTEGHFDIALATPVLEYRIAEEGKISAAKAKESRTKKKEASVKNTFEPLQDLRGWAEYVGAYKAVLMIEAQPQLRETLGSSMLRGFAESGGVFAVPEKMKFAADFYRMKLKCGEKEIEPIQPGKIATVENVHTTFLRVSDATYVGLYSYPADAISPACGKVELEIYSEKEPDKAIVKTLDEKTVKRISADFEPYLSKKKRMEEKTVENR